MSISNYILHKTNLFAFTKDTNISFKEYIVKMSKYKTHVFN